MKVMGHKLTLNPRPEHCPGAYVFFAYCKWINPEHKFDEFPHEPEECRTKGEAMNQLRRDGWIFHRDGFATCPKCARLQQGGAEQ